MTEDKPDGAALLEAARRLLLDELAPLLPAERRYDGLMIANAMAIAARELRDAGRSSAAATRRLAAFYATTAEDADGEALARRLVADIRAGRFDDGAARDRLAALLREGLRDRLAIGNPKALR
jgi:hypothetical protein